MDDGTRLFERFRGRYTLLLFDVAAEAGTDGEVDRLARDAGARFGHVVDVHVVASKGRGRALRRALPARRPPCARTATSRFTPDCARAGCSPTSRRTSARARTSRPSPSTRPRRASLPPHRRWRSPSHEPLHRLAHASPAPGSLPRARRHGVHARSASPASRAATAKSRISPPPTRWSRPGCDSRRYSRTARS